MLIHKEAALMKKTDSDKFEVEILRNYEKGDFVSTAPTKEEKERFKAAAKGTALKDRRVNIRLSSADMLDIQASALEEGFPYQTLIASVLHKYVSDRLVEKPSRLAKRPSREDQSRASG
jgi:predicted DNA binding CopG/RHH family protein